MTPQSTGPWCDETDSLSYDNEMATLFHATHKNVIQNFDVANSDQNRRILF